MTDEILPDDVPVAEDPVTEAADVATPPENPAPPKEDKVQKRIDELTWKNAELQRRLASVEQARKADPPAAPKPIAPPTMEQFGHDETKFAKAQQDYIDSLLDQRIAERLERQERERQAKTRDQTFEQRQADFAKTNSEYMEKVLGAQYLPISEASQELIKEMDLGPQVALHLVNNPEEAYKIMQLPERLQARELGRIEARLEKPAAPVATLPVSKAPPPAPKIEASDGGPSARTTDSSGDKLSDDEWVRLERKRLQRKG